MKMMTGYDKSFIFLSLLPSLTGTSLPLPLPRRAPRALPVFGPLLPLCSSFTALDFLYI
jgi:hypothetical protein